MNLGLFKSIERSPTIQWEAVVFSFDELADINSSFKGHAGMSINDREIMTLMQNWLFKFAFDNDMEFVHMYGNLFIFKKAI